LKLIPKLRRGTRNSENSRRTDLGITESFQEDEPPTLVSFEVNNEKKP
jgi:hypothetical protein